MSDARFDRAVEQSGDPPPGAWTFGVPTADCGPFRWRGQRVEPGDLIAMHPDSELHAVSRPGFSVHTWTVPVRRLEETAERLGLAPPGRSGIVRGAGHTAPVLRAILREALHRRRPVAELAESAIHQIVQSVSGADAPDAARPGGTLQAAMRLRGAIECHAADRPSIADLCDRLGIDPRTARRVFRDQFGVGPKSYLDSWRLTAVRRALRAASPASTRIVDIANRWSFWHMGAFAADYRQMFGELPSETMQRSG